MENLWIKGGGTYRAKLTVWARGSKGAGSQRIAPRG